jgi:hypothetical protein
MAAGSCPCSRIRSTLRRHGNASPVRTLLINLARATDTDEVQWQTCWRPLPWGQSIAIGRTVSYEGRDYALHLSLPRRVKIDGKIQCNGRFGKRVHRAAARQVECSIARRLAMIHAG